MTNGLERRSPTRRGHGEFPRIQKTTDEGVQVFIRGILNPWEYIFALGRRPALRTFVILALLLCSCRTTPDLPPVNLSEPGWTQRQGQAVWRRERDKQEFAGELLLATRGDRVMLQLTKNPLPFVNVQSRGAQWELKYIQQRRFHHGHGVPDADQIWVHLARALNGAKPPAPLVFQLTTQHGFKLENPKTGEMVSGFLNP